jgi:hypothetical protein
MGSIRRRLGGVVGRALKGWFCECFRCINVRRLFEWIFSTSKSGSVSAYLPYVATYYLTSRSNLKENFTHSQKYILSGLFKERSKWNGP